jgi:hypothetical protein
MDPMTLEIFTLPYPTLVSIWLNALAASVFFAVCTTEIQGGAWLPATWPRRRRKPVSAV